MDYLNKQKAKASVPSLLIIVALIVAVILLERTASPAPVKESKVKRLAAGIMATHGQHRWVTQQKAEQLAAEAIEVTQFPEYTWIQPVDLLALAAAESDFRWWLVAENGKPDADGWDCGLTQSRVTIFKGGKTRAARRLCNRIAASSMLGFTYAARELTNYRNRKAYCGKHLGKRTPWKLRRCILNSHKSGPRYCRAGRCGRYWLRVHCFRMGLILKRKPRLRGKRVSCRQAKSLRWIWRVYR